MDTPPQPVSPVAPNSPVSPASPNSPASPASPATPSQSKIKVKSQRQNRSTHSTHKSIQKNLTPPPLKPSASNHSNKKPKRNYSKKKTNGSTHSSSSKSTFEKNKSYKSKSAKSLSSSSTKSSVNRKGNSQRSHSNKQPAQPSNPPKTIHSRFNIQKPILTPLSIPGSESHSNSENNTNIPKVFKSLSPIEFLNPIQVFDFKNLIKPLALSIQISPNHLKYIQWQSPTTFRGNSILIHAILVVSVPYTHKFYNSLWVVGINHQLKRYFQFFYGCPTTQYIDHLNTPKIFNPSFSNRQLWDTLAPHQSRNISYNPSKSLERDLNKHFSLQRSEYPQKNGPERIETSNLPPNSLSHASFIPLINSGSLFQVLNIVLDSEAFFSYEESPLFTSIRIVGSKSQTFNNIDNLVEFFTGAPHGSSFEYYFVHKIMSDQWYIKNSLCFQLFGSTVNSKIAASFPFCQTIPSQCFSPDEPDQSSTTTNSSKIQKSPIYFQHLWSREWNLSLYKSMYTPSSLKVVYVPPEYKFVHPPIVPDAPHRWGSSYFTKQIPLKHFVPQPGQSKKNIQKNVSQDSLFNLIRYFSYICLIVNNEYRSFPEKFPYNQMFNPSTIAPFSNPEYQTNFSLYTKLVSNITSYPTPLEFSFEFFFISGILMFLPNSDTMYWIRPGDVAQLIWEPFPHFTSYRKRQLQQSLDKFLTPLKDDRILWQIQKYLNKSNSQMKLLTQDPSQNPFLSQTARHIFKLKVDARMQPNISWQLIQLFFSLGLVQFQIDPFIGGRSNVVPLQRFIYQEYWNWRKEKKISDPRLMILLIGAPGSGKSTFARYFASTLNSHALRFSNTPKYLDTWIRSNSELVHQEKSFQVNKEYFCKLKKIQKIESQIVRLSKSSKIGKSHTSKSHTNPSSTVNKQLNKLIALGFDKEKAAFALDLLEQDFQSALYYLTLKDSSQVQSSSALPLAQTPVSLTSITIAQRINLLQDFITLLKKSLFDENDTTNKYNGYVQDPLLDWTYINQDLLKSREKCYFNAREALLKGDSHIIIDRCNLSVKQRSTFIRLALEFGLHRIVAVYINTHPTVSCARMFDRRNHETVPDNPNIKMTIARTTEHQRMIPFAFYNTDISSLAIGSNVPFAPAFPHQDSCLAEKCVFPFLHPQSDPEGLLIPIILTSPSLIPLYEKMGIFHFHDSEPEIEPESNINTDGWQTSSGRSRNRRGRSKNYKKRQNNFLLDPQDDFLKFKYVKAVKRNLPENFQSELEYYQDLDQMSKVLVDQIDQIITLKKL